jgi:hypothetical protein
MGSKAPRFTTTQLALVEAYFAVRPDERLATEAFRSYQPTLRTRYCTVLLQRKPALGYTWKS